MLITVIDKETFFNSETNASELLDNLEIIVEWIMNKWLYEMCHHNSPSLEGWVKYFYNVSDSGTSIFNLEHLGYFKVYFWAPE